MKIKEKIYKFLRWTEKYTKTDMIYLTKGGLWLTLGQFVSSLSAFLLAIAFANFLPKEIYGTYKYILSIASILAIPTLQGINTSIIQAVARGYEGSLIPALKTKIKWGILGSLASLGFAFYYYINNNETLAISFLIISLFLPLMDSFGIYSSFLQAKKLFDVSIKYKIISHLTATFFLIATLFFTKNLFIILLAYFLPWTAIRFLFLKITLKKFSPNDKHDPQTISYGKHLSLIKAVGIIASHLDKILIFHYLGAVEVAIYFFAIAPIQQLNSLFKNLYTLALPKLSKRSFKEIDNVILSRLMQLFIIAIFTVLIYFLCAPFLYKILFPKYLESIFYSQIFALIILFKLPILFIASATQSKITLIPKSWLYWSLVPNIILIISLFVFINFLGIMGVIISKIIFTFSILLISFLRWKLVLKKHFQKHEQ